MDVRDSGTGLKGLVEESNGQLHISTLPAGTARIREHIALSTTEATMDWSATPIKAVSITVTQDTAGTAELNGSIAICIDPANDTIRDSWLTGATTLTSDSQRISIPVNTTIEIAFTSPIDYIGMKLDDGTGTYRVFAVGVEA